MAVARTDIAGLSDSGEELVLGHSDRRFAIKALLITGVLLALAAALLWFILHTLARYNTGSQRQRRTPPCRSWQKDQGKPPIVLSRDLQGSALSASW